MRVIAIIITITLSSIFAFGQTAGDALRYSYWNYGGSARYMGTGGSMGALGGDYSSIISNPASIATFRRSELTFTPGVLISGTESNFNNTEFSKNKVSANVNQAGLVFASAKPGDWKTINFGIGYNRLMDFNQTFTYSGTTNGSISDYFKELANGLTTDQLSDYDSWLAYDTYLLYQPLASDPTYYENDLLPNDQTQKFQTVRTKGSMGELNLALGGNFDHKLYVGGSVGVVFLDYNLTKKYEESDINATIDYYEGLEYNEALSTDGVGFNINIGAIYRINQIVRIGAAIHTPTWLSLSDSYNTSLTHDFIDPDSGAGTLTSESPIGTFEYNLRTPWRFIGNAGFVIKKVAFISLEAEWLDYSKNRYNYDSEFADQATLEIEAGTNAQIKQTFQSGLNLKLGGEYVIKELFRLRAGYALYGNPYVNNDGMFNTSQISAGLGYRKNNYFVDLAYVRRMGEQDYAPYVLASGLENSPVVSNNTASDQILVTLGLKFGGKRAK